MSRWDLQDKNVRALVDPVHTILFRPLPHYTLYVCPQVLFLFWWTFSSPALPKASGHYPRTPKSLPLPQGTLLSSACGLCNHLLHLLLRSGVQASKRYLPSKLIQQPGSDCFSRLWSTRPPWESPQQLHYTKPSSKMALSLRLWEGLAFIA